MAVAAWVVVVAGILVEAPVALTATESAMMVVELWVAVVAVVREVLWVATGRWEVPTEDRVSKDLSTAHNHPMPL